MRTSSSVIVCRLPEKWTSVAQQYGRHQVQLDAENEVSA
jgi:hypothetical protein